jgi:hypothetical protein
MTHTNQVTHDQRKLRKKSPKGFWEKKKMIKDLIQNLRLEGRWQEIEDALNDMKQDVVKEMLNGEIKTQSDLDKANARLEVLDQVLNLEFKKEVVKPL